MLAGVRSTTPVLYSFLNYSQNYVPATYAEYEKGKRRKKRKEGFQKKKKTLWKGENVTALLKNFVRFFSIKKEKWVLKQSPRRESGVTTLET